ncbi:MULTISPECIES: homoserine O-acetyltransferase [Kocuria]|uniref:homoserine O-acetyltransferase MetX n=1 Tax=Kocuria TaxID=57493 RepID=UPI0007EB9E14|nr:MULTISPECIES: homoserine O-acetyltransferase [Kocuria]MCT1734266.1 homoserine O-acetyltransferase [Kocuria marina]OBA46342.1 homoserine O-acetyltransferase [Kocuria sp. ICS0012]GHD87439.1 homoserine O-acetyltransferase [Kocuria marina]
MTVVGNGPRTRRDGVVRRAELGELVLESRFRLPDVHLAYETWGELAADGSNAVLIEHALTGDTHVARGGAGHEDAASAPEGAAAAADGWWDGLVGPGAAIDTDRYFVVCANILGGCYGSTGPASPAPDGVPWGSRFPRVTVRDSVTAEALLARALGVSRWRLVIGGSMGGARALEWAVSHPDRVAACAVIAANARVGAEQLAWGQAQSLAIRQDPNFRGGDYYAGEYPEAGLGLARRIAHITYRSAHELETRFGRDPQPREDPEATHVADRGRYQVESYLDHQASKLAGRFDANSYLSVNETLMSHDVARGRGELRDVLARTRCEWLVAAVDSDRLFFPSESAELVAALPGEQELHTITSPSGHDGFLIETPQVGMLLRETVLRD